MHDISLESSMEKTGESLSSTNNQSREREVTGDNYAIEMTI